jgi:nicotinamide phosphoribosyltransferase
LWEIFGGTETDKGYKILDEHIGLIYRDPTTLERAKAILERLEEKGFALGNVVFGVGSYTCQFAMRDNFGFAMKATSGVANGERRDIFKDPKTDSRTRRSAKALLCVEREGNTLVLYDQQSQEEEDQGVADILEETGKMSHERGRPVASYRSKTQEAHFFIRNIEGGL